MFCSFQITEKTAICWKGSNIMESERGSVFTILRRRDQKLLFQFRDSNVPAGALQMSFFGGGVDVGDADALAAAKRHALRELHLQLLNGDARLVGEIVHPVRTTPLFICTARSQILDGRFMVREGAGAVFLSLEEIRVLLAREGWFTPATALVATKILEGEIKLD